MTCGWHSKFKTRLNEHVEAKHVETGGYSCPLCGKFCSSKNALKLHKSKYHRDSVGLSTNFWNKIMKIFDDLLNFHVISYVISGFIDEEIKSRILAIGKSEFQCTECGHVTTKKTNLLRHIESKHMILEAIACKYCSKMCPSKNALSSHVSRYHRF